jgi:hypothetical protein
MKCDYQAVCPFHRRKIEVDDAAFDRFHGSFCEANSTACAVYQVIQESSFLAVPKDLMPDQTHKVYQIVSNSIYS